MVNFFNLSLWFNGFPINKAKAEFNRISKMKGTDFEDFIFKKRKEIVDYHLKSNHNYQDFVGQTVISNWDAVPIQNKKNFQKPLKQRLSDDFSLKNIYINKTSGSSGNPFIFAKDKYCHALTWANIINRFGDFGIDFNTSKQARFYGIPLDFLGNKKERFKDFLSS